MIKPTKRLIKARRELLVLISMVENDAQPLQLISQSRKVQLDLNAFNREILSYHLFLCVRKQIRNTVLLNELDNITKVLGIRYKFSSAGQLSTGENMKEH